MMIRIDSSKMLTAVTAVTCFCLLTDEKSTTGRIYGQIQFIFGYNHESDIVSRGKQCIWLMIIATL